MFPTTYEESRARMLTHRSAVGARWPDAEIESHTLAAHPDLSLDWIVARPPQRRRLLMLTTGVHGIEGYVGAAMLDLFVAEFAPRLDPQDTALILLHAVNPWGMKAHRRVNANNVDLNRNFVAGWEGMADVNPEYDRLPPAFNAARPLGRWLPENLGFYAAVARSVLRFGATGTRETVLRGQYRRPRGVYFGGTETQEETQVLMGLQQAALAEYGQVVHLDMHTGYGPRTQMTIVSAAGEPASSEECARNFRYPRVVRPDPDEFYTIHGDLIDYWYELRQARYPERQVYAAAFEFGTFGSSLPAAIRSLRASVMENRLALHGTPHRSTLDRIRREYEAQFNPAEPAWRDKALQDARQAFEGILECYGLIGAGGHSAARR
jgi:hypothetical protein